MKTICIILAAALLFGCAKQKPQWVMNQNGEAVWITNIVLRSHDADVRMELSHLAHSRDAEEKIEPRSFLYVIATTREPLHWQHEPVWFVTAKQQPRFPSLGESLVKTNQWIENGNSRVRTEFFYDAVPDWFTRMLRSGTNGAFVIDHTSGSIDGWLTPDALNAIQAFTNAVARLAKK